MERRSIRVIALTVVVVLVVGVAITLAIIRNGQTPESTVQLTKVGQIDIGEAVSDVKVVGAIAYVIDQSEHSLGGLVLVNVSNPSNPTELSSYRDGGWPQRVDVAGGFAYIADAFYGLEVINVSDPMNPTKVGEYVGSGEVYDVQVVDNIAFIADWNNGLVVLNVSDPSNPVYLSEYYITGACPHVHVIESLAFVVDHRSTQTGLTVVNVSDILHPAFAGSYMPDDEIWNPFVCGDWVYAGNHEADGGELLILNASNPSGITPSGIFDANGSIFAACVEDNIAYVADFQLGLLVVDVSIPQNPTMIASFYDEDGAVNLDIVGDLVYVAHRTGVLKIIRVSMI